MNHPVPATYTETAFLIQGQPAANETEIWQTLDELEVLEEARRGLARIKALYEGNPQRAVRLRLVERVKTTTFTELSEAPPVPTADGIEAPSVVTIKKIVSGGQSGVETVALAAAKTAGIQTGGFMLKNFHDGMYKMCPERATEYGLSEHKSTNAGDQTRKNCALADGTLWIMDGRGVMVAGSYAYNTGHPYLKLTEHDLLNLDIALATVHCWLVQHRIETLHISGQQFGPHPTNDKQEAVIKNLFTALFAKWK